MTELPSRPKKRLGQNFLCDDNVLHRLLAFIAPSANDIMVEIGAGTGALTALLAPRLSKLYAIEIDSGMLPYLQPIEGVQIITQDVLKVDVCRLMAGNQQLRVAGNLPYYISTAILNALLRQRDCIQDMVLMFQDEVAHRILARPSDHDYSYLSVISQYFCDIDKGFRISKNCFRPRPEVDSRVLALRINRETRFDFPVYSNFVKQAFSQRRKKLRNNLLRCLDIDPHQLDSLFQRLNIGADSRAETLTPSQFEALLVALQTA